MTSTFFDTTRHVGGLVKIWVDQCVEQFREIVAAKFCSEYTKFVPDTGSERSRYTLNELAAQLRAEQVFNERLITSSSLKRVLFLVPVVDRCLVFN